MSVSQRAPSTARLGCKHAPKGSENLVSALEAAFIGRAKEHSEAVLRLFEHGKPYQFADWERVRLTEWFSDVVDTRWDSDGAQRRLRVFLINGLCVTPMVHCRLSTRRSFTRAL